MSTALLIFIAIATVLITILVLFFISSWISKRFFSVKENEFSTQPNKFVILLVSICILLLTISGFLPFILTRDIITTDFDFMQTGPIGDTIGGIMGPIINIVAVIVTGLAFYMQYRANKLQVSLFNKQMKESNGQFKTEQGLKELQLRKTQFESQFYTMLDLHRQNVANIKLSENINGSFAFSELFDELASIYFISYDFIKNIKKKDLNEKVIYNISYLIFFFGLSAGSTEIFKSFLEKKYHILIDELENHFTSYPIIKKNQSYSYDYNGSKISIVTTLNHEPFKGHQYHLSHYQRHLFRFIKFIDDQEEIILDYNKKYEYTSIVRAQLSIYEQILLYYNSISILGEPWHAEDHNFIRKYCLVKSMPLPLVDFYLNPQTFLGIKNQYNKPMFEWNEIQNRMREIIKENNGKQYRLHIHHK